MVFDHQHVDLSTSTEYFKWTAMVCLKCEGGHQGNSSATAARLHDPFLINTVQCRYNVVSFSPESLQKTSHNSVVSLKSDLRSASVIAVPMAISRETGPRYNGTRLYWEHVSHPIVYYCSMYVTMSLTFKLSIRHNRACSSVYFICFLMTWLYWTR